MRLLFLSDVTSWSTYKEVFDSLNPDLVLMGGDLVSDGLANFWAENRYKLIITIPELRARLLDFLDKHKKILRSNRPFRYDKAINCIKNGYTGEIRTSGCYASSPLVFADTLFFRHEKIHSDFHKLWGDLEKESCKSKEFQSYVMENHISKFYEALHYSGKNCDAVFVVMGDHDFYDFPKSYSQLRINSISNIHEISGKILRYQNLRILGLGYMETHYLRKLKPLISLYQDKVDLLLTHAEQRRMPLLAKIKPQIIFRGHYMQGLYKVVNINTASAIFPAYITAEIEDNNFTNIEYVEPTSNN